MVLFLCKSSDGICTKFHENILDGIIKVIEPTRFS